MSETELTANCRFHRKDAWRHQCLRTPLLGFTTLWNFLPIPCASISTRTPFPGSQPIHHVLFNPQWSKQGGVKKSWLLTLSQNPIWTLAPRASLKTDLQTMRCWIGTEASLSMIYCSTISGPTKKAQLFITLDPEPKSDTQSDSTCIA